MMLLLASLHNIYEYVSGIDFKTDVISLHGGTSCDKFYF